MLTNIDSWIIVNLDFQWWREQRVIWWRLPVAPARKKWTTWRFPFPDWIQKTCWQKRNLMLPTKTSMQSHDSYPSYKWSVFRQNLLHVYLISSRITPFNILNEFHCCQKPPVLRDCIFMANWVELYKNGFCCMYIFFLVEVYSCLLHFCKFKKKKEKYW